MGEVINLNQYRKQRARLVREQVAAANRARTGRTKQAKDTARRERDRDASRLDSKLLEDKSDREEAPENG